MDAPTDLANRFFFFLLMNSSPSSLMGYSSFFKYIFSMRWVQVTSDVTLKSYTFFKLLDLNRSNG